MSWLRCRWCTDGWILLYQDRSFDHETRSNLIGPQLRVLADCDRRTYPDSDASRSPAEGAKQARRQAECQTLPVFLEETA
jgi:hypothetical protein